MLGPSGAPGPGNSAWRGEREEADGGPVGRGDISGDFFWRFSSPRLLGEGRPLAWPWPRDSWGGGWGGTQQRCLLCPAPLSGSMEHLCAQPGGGPEKQMSGQGGWPRGPEAGEVSGPGCWLIACINVYLTFVSSFLHSFVHSLTQLWFPEPQLCTGHGPKRDKPRDGERTRSWAVAARVPYLASKAGILLSYPIHR